MLWVDGKSGIPFLLPRTTWHEQFPLLKNVFWNAHRGSGESWPQRRRKLIIITRNSQPLPTPACNTPGLATLRPLGLPKAKDYKNRILGEGSDATAQGMLDAGGLCLRTDSFRNVVAESECCQQLQLVLFRFVRMNRWVPSGLSTAQSTMRLQAKPRSSRSRAAAAAPSFIQPPDNL